MPHRPPVGAAAVLVALIGVAGCGYGAVDVDPFQPEPETSRTCSALVDELPRTVDDAVRRDVEPADLDGHVAAWGQPVIVLRCGVPMPATYRPDAQLLEVDAIGWLPEPGGGGTFFTAVDRAVIIEVAVPDDYAPEASVLADLAPAIRRTVPARTLQ